jgi:YwiC-like protein
MTLSTTNSNSENSDNQSQTATSSRSPAWYRPTFSPEHGAYVVLFGAFLTGVALAQHWTLTTTLALICAFAGFQSEHPLALQIKQRRSWKPQFLLWGGIYGGISLSIAVYLYLQMPMLLWIYLGAIAAFMIDAIAVFYRQQRSMINEILTFSAICLTTPFAYAVTSNGKFDISVLGLWLLNTLFFSSAIFTVKLRKPKTSSLVPSLIYHAIASCLITGLWLCGWLNVISALAFGVVLFKFGLIIGLREWYQKTQIRNVAILETFSALIFTAIVSISLLPSHLPATI